jgi:hypothetical protein
MLRSSILTALLAAGLCLPQAAIAKDYAVILSSYLTPEQAKLHAKQSIITTLDILHPSDSATFYDGARRKTITQFSLPSKVSSTNIRVKLRLNADSIRKVNQFALTAHLPRGGAEPNKAGAIQLPEMMRVVENNFPNQPMDVLIFGNPLYPSNSGFSMEGGLIPGDGHLSHSLGTTPFGIDHPKALQGKRIHWYTGGTDWALNEQHRYLVERFWSLYFAKQGAVLASFNDDFPSVVNSLQNHRAAPQSRYAPAPATKKLEMIRVRPPQLKTSTSIYDRPITQVKPSIAMVSQARNVEIGIRWQCNQSDLDLYTRPTPSTKTLYYGMTQSPYGVYLKDYRSSPKNFFETVQLTQPVDLRKTLVAVNYYGGESASPVTGELRVSWQGRTYRKAFTFTPRHGNGGQQADVMARTGRAPSAHWVVFNLPDMMGL